MSYRRPPPSYGVPALRDSPEYNASRAYRKVTTLLDAHRESVKMTSNDEHAEDGEWAQWPAVEIPTPPVVDKAERYAQDIENALMHKRMKVPREAQFWEGNYDRAIAAVRSILEPLKLWTRANSPPIFIGDVSQQARIKVQMDCERAVFIIMSYVCEEFADKIGIYRGSHRSDELLKLLRERCKPFRLMDLSKELRDHICGFWVDGPVERPPCNLWRWSIDEHDARCEACWTPTSRKYRLLDLFEPPSAQIRRLWAVSKQIRAEVLKTFYSIHKFCCLFDHANFPGCIDEKLEELEDIGLEHLRHVRDLEVSFDWHKAETDDFYMVWSPEKGFEVQLWKRRSFCNSDTPGATMERMRDLAIVVQQRKSRGEWSGTGIMEILMLELDLLRTAMYGSPLYSQWDLERINERDAYQVAYGPKPIRATPW